eukprot:CAMPEP_0197176222 /NCGR_PEP_ID=MMETSP1423-20130617/2222_1 /TAXON_ID=476441 /ORGANISM="Pseudo-nitzschia heimii, Strain UNC1101" /LENGTH=186 /DNA_ID=CAMNT_0042625563 /DNA_START=120 /DNA_END=680 /DNA_ORIENTATION=+
MNQCYRNKHQRTFSQRVEDSSSEGVMASSKSINGRQSILTSVVKAASVFNNVLLENCNICTIYCDKQVQYEEYVQQQYDVGTGAMGHLYSQLNATAAATSITPINAIPTSNADDDKSVFQNSDFVNPINEAKTPPNNLPRNPGMNGDKERTKVEKLYRDFLFDEESVVRSVGTRGGIDDDGDGGEE